MSNILNFEKLLTLPSVLEPSTVYFVVNQTNSAFIDGYVSDVDGLTAKKLWSLEDTQQYITNALLNTSLTNITIVNDIFERDNLSLSKSFFVLVKDATSDPTVLSGSASYVWDFPNQTWIKLSEYESLDISFDWNSIINRPNKTKEEIEDAVDKKHAHGNLTILEGIGEDINQKLTYKGVVVGSGGSASMKWSKEEW